MGWRKGGKEIIFMAFELLMFWNSVRYTPSVLDSYKSTRAPSFKDTRHTYVSQTLAASAPQS